MSSEVIKGLRFGDSQESYFEAWKRSHMDCSALLSCRFADSQESRFQFRKVQIWVVLSWKVTVLLIFTNSVLKLQNVEIWTVSKCKGFFDDFYEWHFISRNVQIITVPYCNRVD